MPSKAISMIWSLSMPLSDKYFLNNTNRRMIFPYEFAAYGTGAIIQSDIRPMALVMHLDICKEHM